nr:TonB-dependent receptor [Azospirillum oleiclasticum]
MSAVKIFATGGLVGAVVISALLSSTADAQEAAEARPDTIVLDPLLVTARRRVENAQDAPVAVTVVPEEDVGLGQVDTLEDMAFRSPNTLYNDQGGPLSIRGVGSLGISAGVDRQPSVGVFLDDVFIARPFGYPTHLNDIQRIEVVRGSQATLYGKNTIGGAVNMTSRDPGDRFGVQLEGDIAGTRDLDSHTGRLTGAFDAPLSDGGRAKLGVRGYASWNRSPGYITNSDGDTVSDTDSLATRFAMKGEIGDATTIRISVDYSRDRDDGGLWYATVENAFKYKADHDYPATRDLDIAGISGRLDHDFGGVILTSITAFRGHSLETILDGDFTSDPGFPLVQAQTEEQRQFSQELRLSGGSGPVEARGGLFYMHEWFEGDQFYDMASLPRGQWSRTDFTQDTDTFSAFSEVSYAITPALKLIGGLRYTYEIKEATSETSSPSGTFFMGTPGRVSETDSFQNLSPELSIVYQIDDRNLTFAKVSRGFKSGGISPFIDVNNQPNRYDPEVTTSYEIGAKALWFGDRLRVSGSLFYTDWNDQQAVTYTSPSTRIISNAAEATSKGVELEASLQVTRGLSFNASYGYLDAKYDEFIDRVLGADHSGNPLPYAPKHSAGLGARLTMPIDDHITVRAGLDYSYRSSYSFTADNAYRQDPTHLVDARIGVGGAGWSATLWAKNLADEQYLRQYFDFGGVDMGVAAEGRTFGLTVAATW